MENFLEGLLILICPVAIAAVVFSVCAVPFFVMATHIFSIFNSF